MPSPHNAATTHGGLEYGVLGIAIGHGVQTSGDVVLRRTAQMAAGNHPGCDEVHDRCHWGQRYPRIQDRHGAKQLLEEYCALIVAYVEVKASAICHAVAIHIDAKGAPLERKY